MATITVDGNRIEVPDGHSVTINSRNGTLEINGNVIGVSGRFAGKTARIEIVGATVGSVRADGSVTCENVSGNVNAGGSITCGNVTASASAGGSVRCGSVGGNASAGGSVHMMR